MSVNKVQLANGETIIDISDSTVTPETLAEGVTAHDASGTKITGTMPAGSGSVQSDWNQTDSSAADFIKNKPFYDHRVETVIIEEGEYIAEGGIAFISDNAIELNLGQVYTVYFDNMVYQIIPVTFPEGIIIGDMNLTTYPFAITAVEGVGTIAMFLDELPHKVKMVSKVGDMEQIDSVLLSTEWAATSLEREDVIVPFGSYDFSSGNDTFQIERNYSISEKVWNESMSLKIILDDVEYKNKQWGALRSDAGDVKLTVDGNTTIMFWHDNRIMIITTTPIMSFGLSIVDKIPRKMPTEYLPEIPAEKFVLASSSGKQFIITVDDSGTLTATEVTA